MEFATWFICRKEMFENIGFMQSLVRSKYLGYANTIRPYKAVAGSGIVNAHQDGNDFIRNMITVSIKFKAYKVPRIAFKNNRNFKSHN